MNIHIKNIENNNNALFEMGKNKPFSKDFNADNTFYSMLHSDISSMNKMPISEISYNQSSIIQSEYDKPKADKEKTTESYNHKKENNVFRQENTEKNSTDRHDSKNKKITDNNVQNAESTNSKDSKEVNTPDLKNETSKIKKENLISNINDKKIIKNNSTVIADNESFEIKNKFNKSNISENNKELVNLQMSKKTFSKPDQFTDEKASLIKNVFTEKNKSDAKKPFSKNLVSENILDKKFEIEFSDFKKVNKKNKFNKGKDNVNIIAESGKNVSRETIQPRTAIFLKEMGLHKDLNNDNLLNKLIKPDKENIQPENIKHTSNSSNAGFSFNSAFTGKSFSIQGDNALFSRSSLNHQIEAMFQRAKVQIKENGNANLSTTLYPKEMGKVSLKLFLNDGVLHGHLTVDNNAVQKEIALRLERVLDNLRNDGFEVSHFDVNVQSGDTSSFENTEGFVKNDGSNAKKTDENNSNENIVTSEKKEGTYA
ncbi:MAG: flagellar hook-length control protein FliK [Spirochaetia bacterium]|nr:flagellar hook-length control protein FliK [Spirochaetia bacterium]